MSGFILSSLLAVVFQSLQTQADFFISNTTVCYGPVSACISSGAQIITGNTPNKTFTCDKAFWAQDDSYIRNGTMGPGPGGIPHTFADNVCGAGRLDFVKEGDGYFVEDKDGNHVGDCTLEVGHNMSCDALLGGYGYFSMYQCNTTGTDA